MSISLEGKTKNHSITVLPAEENAIKNYEPNVLCAQVKTRTTRDYN